MTAIPEIGPVEMRPPVMEKKLKKLLKPLETTKAQEKMNPDQNS